MSYTETVADACELITDGTHYTPKNAGAGYPFLTVKDVSDEHLDFVDCSFIAEVDYLAAKAGNASPQCGDVLFSKDGTVGKVHVVKTNRPFAVLSSLAILRPRPERVDAQYLGHVLRSPAVLEDAIKRKTGSAIRRIILSDLKRVGIPLPPLPEQRRIASILDQADTLRAKRRVAIAQFDALAQSIFLDLFGDPVTNSKEWNVQPLGELARIIRGASPRPKGDPRYFGGRIPWLMISDVTAEPGRLVTRTKQGVTEAGRDKSVYLQPGTLVLTNSATVGVPKVLGIAACIHDGFLAFLDIDERIEKEFLYMFFLLMRAQLSHLAPEGTQKNLNTGIAKALRMIVPPLDLQQEFCRCISVIDRLRADSGSARGYLDALFASLQYRAFRGDL